jgi:hypothetical protein
MRIEAEFLKLLIPLGVRIAQTFDIDAAGQAPFDRCLDELGSKGLQRALSARRPPPFLFRE